MKCTTFRNASGIAWFVIVQSLLSLGTVAQSAVANQPADQYSEGAPEAIWTRAVSELNALPAIPSRFPLIGEQLIEYEAYRDLEQEWLDHARSQGWRAALNRCAADLGLPALRHGRVLQRVLAILIEQYHDTLTLAGQRPSPARTFSRLLQGACSEEELLSILLGAVGVIRPSDHSRIELIMGGAEHINRHLPELDREAVEKQSTAYLRNFVAGKYPFHGLSIGVTVLIG